MHLIIILYQLKTLFELNWNYKKQFLGTIKAKCDEDARRRAIMKGTRQKEHQDMIELRKNASSFINNR